MATTVLTASPIFAAAAVPAVPSTIKQCRGHHTRDGYARWDENGADGGDRGGEGDDNNSPRERGPR